MRIDSMNQVSQVYRMNRPKKINTAYQASFNDSVEISQLGKDIQIAKKAIGATPDIREDKVAAMKAAFASGYSVSDSDLADKLVESFAI
ncbi:MAG: flagellar biosynthesis anti-sigma factor FlgM [Lachnospiraceae bacterium]|nr:flagellar biosynthesis anti-sigma factor FlgM [Lachnospiraceae bacterium]